MWPRKPLDYDKYLCFVKFSEISEQRVAEHKLGEFVLAIKVKIFPYYNEAVLGRSVG